MKNFINIILLFIIFSTGFILVGCSSSHNSSEVDKQELVIISSGKFSAHAFSNQIALKWDIDGSIFTLKVYDDNELIREITTSDNEILLDNMDKDKSYKFVLNNSGALDNSNLITYCRLSSDKSQPQIVTAKAFNSRAILRWESLHGVAYYNIYISDNGKDFSFLGSHSTNSAMIDGLENGHTYFFTVTAFYNEIASNNFVNFKLENFTTYYGNITTVTPGSDTDRNINIFQANKNDNDIYFIWDALPNIKEYRFSSSDSAYGEYEVIQKLQENIIRVKLPQKNNHYTVTPVFTDGVVGDTSQYIEIIYDINVNWVINGDDKSAKAIIYNYSDFDQVDLKCRKKGDLYWVDHEVSNYNVTVSSLTCGSDYECKVDGHYLDEVYSSLKEFSTLPCPVVHYNDSVSTYTWDNKTMIRWNMESELYKVKLSVNEQPPAIIEEVVNKEILLKDLSCNTTYKAYIEFERDGFKTVSKPVKFNLNNDYCSKQIPVISGTNKSTYIIDNNDGCKLTSYSNKVYALCEDGVYILNDNNSDSMKTKLISLQLNTNRPYIPYNGYIYHLENWLTVSKVNIDNGKIQKEDIKYSNDSLTLSYRVRGVLIGSFYYVFNGNKAYIIDLIGLQMVEKPLSYKNYINAKAVHCDGKIYIFNSNGKYIVYDLKTFDEVVFDMPFDFSDGGEFTAIGSYIYAFINNKGVYLFNGTNWSKLTITGKLFKIKEGSLTTKGNEIYYTNNEGVYKFTP